MKTTTLTNEQMTELLNEIASVPGLNLDNSKLSEGEVRCYSAGVTVLVAYHLAIAGGMGSDNWLVQWVPGVSLLGLIEAGE